MFQIASKRAEALDVEVTTEFSSGEPAAFDTPAVVWLVSCAVSSVSGRAARPTVTVWLSIAVLAPLPDIASSSN